MAEIQDRKGFTFSEPGKYRMRVLGSLSESWAGKMAGMHIITSHPKGQKDPITELTGMVRDQAELSGILETLYDLHLTLLSVEMLDPGFVFTITN